MRVGSRFQPELRRVVSEGLEMPREEIVVPGFCPGAPLPGLGDAAHLGQNAGELRRVTGSSELIFSGRSRAIAASVGLSSVSCSA